MAFQVVPLAERHLEDAAALVAARFRRLRARLPLLPARYAAPGAILELLAPVAREGRGLAALEGRRLVGFLDGLPLRRLAGRPAVWSPEWANATVPERSREVVTALYAHAAGQWAAEGRPVHAVSLLADDAEGREGWHWLGFGMVVVDAVRGPEPTGAPPAGLPLRPAGVDEAARLEPLFEGLWDHLAAPPTFLPHERRGAHAWLALPGTQAWVAEEGGVPLACLAARPGYEDGCQVLQDEETLSVTCAYTLPQARGRGLATALVDAALAHARAGGYARLAVDFESANPWAARFWTRWFEPACFSLLRVLDEGALAAPPGGDA